MRVAFTAEVQKKANSQGATIISLTKRNKKLENSEEAIEIDFAEKWAESIGQSLYYSIQTGRRTGGAIDYGEPS